MTATSPGTAVVVGAGIAGLTTALALLDAGWSCRVYEAAPGPHPEGAGIHVAPNGMRVLQRLGVDLARYGSAMDALAIRRWANGRIIGTLDLTGIKDAPYYTLHRADLNRALRAGIPEGTVTYGAAVTRVDEDADGVRVRLSDGSSVRSDLLIGADGIHSTIRNQLCGDSPRYTGNVMYRGIVPSDRVPESVDPRHATIWAGPERHFVAYPISGGSAYYISASADGQPWTSPGWSEPGDPDMVLGHYEDWDATVTHLLTSVTTMTRWALYDRPLSSAWKAARITLVGDAAHAMPPFLAQAANLAMEDAVRLAASLATHADPVEALRAYESERAERVRTIHDLTAEHGARFRLPDGPRQQARDADLARGSMASDFGWIFDYNAASSPT
ncbi:FAD-dependent monooxygenase [Streptomyces sp. NPDC020681]|uniref:FAD-dependent monooxygenase n=1 Tax=Streptomyces sp. NPDC020681 TaxID=3365083 RepID=UPI00379E11BE